MDKNFKFTTRIATKSDLDKLIPLFDAYRMFYGQASDLPRVRAFVKSRLQDDTIILVAIHTDTQEIIGFCSLFPSLSTVNTGKIFILNDLYVKETLRREGIGAALLQAAVITAEENGAIKLKLETADNNFSAQGLYSKLGWKKSHFITFVKGIERQQAIMVPVAKEVASC